MSGAATAATFELSSEGVSPRLDCNPSFADEYVGGFANSDGIFTVKITYVDVARFLGNDSGTLDITAPDGVAWRNFNASPTGDSVVLDVKTSQAGDNWQADLYAHDGRGVCSQKFRVSYEVPTR